MRICIVGAGAIGGMLGAQLVLAGEEVTFISRGANLEAFRNQGIKLILVDGTERRTGPLTATERITEAGVHDLVILTLKAHQLTAVAGEIPSLLGPGSTVVTMQNGIPWWYFLGEEGPYQGTRIEAVDPGGLIAASIDVGRIIGCVVYLASEITAPGVIRQLEGERLSVGELDGSKTPRVETVSALFRRAGFKSPVVSDIRSEIWLKLWGNACFNPISALTHATLEDICRFPLTRDLAAGMMEEIQQIGEKLGAGFRVSIDRRIRGAEAVGKHKTSMLQDVEQGRSLELEAIVGAVVEMARMTSTPAPRLQAVYACASLLARTLQDENGRLRVEPIGGKK